MLYINKNILCRPLNEHSKFSYFELIVFELQEVGKKGFF